MASTFVDSNILLDFAGDESEWATWSANALQTAGDRGPLVINAIVYSEASVRFNDAMAFDRVVPPNRYLREPIPMDAAFIAGKRHTLYRQQGGSRVRTLPDFLIGAHALVRGYCLLTRDAARYRTYFPELDFFAPDTSA